MDNDEFDKDLGGSLDSDNESSTSEYGGHKESGTRLYVLDTDWEKKREGEIRVRQCKGMCDSSSNPKGVVQWYCECY